MSIDFVVLCTRPMPPAWRGAIALGELPFAFFTEDVGAWKADTAAWLAESPAAERSEFEAWLDEQLGERWSFVARFSCRPAAAELVEQCAQILCEHFGGVFCDDHSEAITAPSPGRSDPSAAMVIARWQALELQREALDARTLDQARREFTTAAADDPEAHDEANDWSDL